MAEKIINSRIQLKTDTSSNWSKATNFIPKKGEFIFYSDLQKFKMGDGSTKLSVLDFVNEDAKIATQNEAGLMSSADKTKLDGIAAGANKYILPTASSTTLGGVKSGSSVTSTTGLTACPIIGGVPYYKEGTESGGGSSSVTALTKVQFDEVWQYQNEDRVIVYNGTLTSTQAYYYTEYDCIMIDLYGPAEDVEVSNRYIYLFVQSNYWEDNDTTDYWRWVGYDRSNKKYTLDIACGVDSCTWTLTTDSSSGSGSGSGGGIVAKYTTIGGTAEFPVSISKFYFFEIYNISSDQYGRKAFVGWFTFENGQIKNSIGGDLCSAQYDSTTGKVFVGMGDQISGQYLVIQYPAGQGDTTCIVENTPILIKDRTTNELTTKLVQDIKVGDELAFWSPIAGGLSYNKVIMPVVVGDCTAYNKVCFSDGSYVNVYGNQLFWDVDKDAMISYKEMTTENRVCKQDGTIVHFNHIEEMVSDAVLKHYTIMTQYGKFIANGVQTGDKVELFYPRFQRDENLSYWMKLTDKERQFYIDKYNDGLTRRNWFTSELYRETLYPLFKQKREQNKLLEEKQAYLDSTDYQVVKKMEGLLTDEEFAPVKVARQEARDAINAARARIAELEATIKEKEAEVKATIYGKRKYTYHNAFEGKTRAVLDDEEPSAD